jgi:CRISPR-associated protein Csd1
MLQALIDYAERHLDSEPGFKTREVRWHINLSEDGRFLNVLPLGDGKRGQSQLRCPDMHGMVAGGRAHFLVETAQTAVLLFKTGEEQKKITTAMERHHFYARLLRKASASIPQLKPVSRLLEDETKLSEIREALTAKKVKPADWVGWRVNDADPRLNEAVQAWWRDWRRADLNETASDSMMVCFVTGEKTRPLPTHPKITGLASVGGLSMGDVMVGFDKAAFGSFGLGKSANAAMSADGVQKYVDSLNDLIRNHSRKLANTLVVHWFKARVEPEDDPLAFLHGFETEEQTEAAALAAVRRLLESIRIGERGDLGNNQFYAITLSGAAGRVMVRDWMVGRFEELARNVESWFSDFSIVAWNGQGTAFDPKFYEVCLALVRNDRSKSISKNLEQLPASATAALWRAAVKHLPIPQPLMVQALTRFRTDLVKDEPFSHARMGLIKAYFIRRNQGGDSTMTAYLNPDHPESAYHCGRLLAVLANLQHAALGDVGAGVVQRYYAAASQTPGLIIGRLVSNARNHLGKLDAGLAWWYEERLAEIMSRLKDRIPRILDLEGQGLFALGYYQQIAALRAGNKSAASNGNHST